MKNIDFTDTKSEDFRTGEDVGWEEGRAYEQETTGARLEAEIAALTKKLAASRETALMEAIDSARLRDAFEAIEWTNDDAPHADENKFCPFCQNFESDGHAADCSRQSVLRRPSPRADAVRAVLNVAEELWGTKESEDFWNTFEKLEYAVAAYRALLAGGDADGVATWLK